MDYGGTEAVRQRKRRVEKGNTSVYETIYLMSQKTGFAWHYVSPDNWSILRVYIRVLGIYDMYLQLL